MCSSDLTPKREFNVSVSSFLAEKPADSVYFGSSKQQIHLHVNRACASTMLPKEGKQRDSAEH